MRTWRDLRRSAELIEVELGRIRAELERVQARMAASGEATSRIVAELARKRARLISRDGLLHPAGAPVVDGHKLGAR